MAELLHASKVVFAYGLAMGSIILMVVIFVGILYKVATFFVDQNK